MDQSIDVRPEQCGQWGTVLLGEDCEPERQQVTEFPRLPPIVPEYRRQRLYGGTCGARPQAAGPVTPPRGRFGPRVQATVGYVTGRSGAKQRVGQDS